MIGTKPTFSDFISSKSSDGVFFTTLEPINVRTKALNEKLGLFNHQAVFFQVPAGLYSDGASIPEILRFIIPRRKKYFYISGFIHDHTHGEGYIRAYILDLQTGVITDDLGTISLTKHESNMIFNEKVNSWYAPVYRRLMAVGMLELVRILQGKE